MNPVVALGLAYVAGSIPSAYLIGRARGIDLRQHGSGNLGATNAVRVLGAPLGALVYLLDTLKGFLPVALLPGLIESPLKARWALAFGVAAIVGHIRPLFLGFKKGGKGVATAGGVFLGLAPTAALAGVAIFALVLLATGYASLASLVTAAAFPVALLATGTALRSELFIVAVLMALFVLYAHRTNIARLRSGQEHRFRRKKAADPAPSRS